MNDNLDQIRRYADRVNLERVGVLLAFLLFWTAVIALLTGCACPPQSYQPVPTWLVPGQPTVPTVMATDLACLSDDAYTRLATRDRVCWQHVRELRALLGSEP